MVPFTVGGTKYFLDLPSTLPPRKIEHPFGYILSHHAMAEGYVNLIYDMIKDLPKGMDVTDLMGGIGVFPKVFWNVLQPKSWISVEIDNECKQYFQEPRAQFFLGNAYNYPIDGDLVFIDMPNGTLRTIAEDMDGRLLMWHHIRSARPRYVQVTDHGYYWVHLPNHAPWYQKTFGQKATKDNYHIFWDKWMRENIGYKVVNEKHGFHSQYFTMEPV